MAEPMDLLFSTPKMSTAFSPEAHVQGMLTMALAPHIGRPEAQRGGYGR